MSSGAQRKLQPVTGERRLLAWIVSRAFLVGDKFAGGRVAHPASSPVRPPEWISPMAGAGVTAGSGDEHCDRDELAGRGGAHEDVKDLVIAEH